MWKEATEDAGASIKQSRRDGYRGVGEAVVQHSCKGLAKTPADLYFLKKGRPRCARQMRREERGKPLKAIEESRRATLALVKRPRHPAGGRANGHGSRAALRSLEALTKADEAALDKR
jgi:hypothetical protein